MPVCTCIVVGPVPRHKVLWSDGTGDDEGEGKHNGEAQEQGEKKDCRPPVGEFGEAYDFLAALLLQLRRRRWGRSRLPAILSPLQRVALSSIACGLHWHLNALPACRSAQRGNKEIWAIQILVESSLTLLFTEQWTPPVLNQSHFCGVSWNSSKPRWHSQI